jgi:hypothetical protein
MHDAQDSSTATGGAVAPATWPAAALWPFPPTVELFRTLPILDESKPDSLWTTAWSIHDRANAPCAMHGEEGA